MALKSLMFKTDTGEHTHCHFKFVNHQINLFLKILTCNCKIIADYASLSNTLSKFYLNIKKMLLHESYNCNLLFLFLLFIENNKCILNYIIIYFIPVIIRICIVEKKFSALRRTKCKLTYALFEYS